MPNPEQDGFVPDDGFKSDGFVPDTQPTKPQEPGIIDKLGGWRGLAGTGTRALSGILSAEGGIPGAAISGLGEGAAELIEGSKPSLTKMGVEAGFGAIPFGKVVKAGELLPSIARSGALGAAHTGVSQLAGGQSLDPTSIAEGGVMGGAMGALGSFLGGRGKTNKPTDYTIEPTNRGEVPGKMSPGKLLSPVIKGTGEPIGIAPSGGSSITPPTPFGGDVTGEGNSRVQRMISKEIADAAKQAKIDAKATADQAAQDAITAQMEGRVAQPPSIRTSVSAPNLEGPGRISMSQAHIIPKENAPDPVEELVRQHLGAPATTDPKAAINEPPLVAPPTVPMEAQVPPIPEATSQESPLAKFLSKPSRSKKTTEGFQSGVDKILGNYPEVGAPETITPEPTPTPPEVAGQEVLNAGQPFKSPLDAVGAAYRGGDVGGLAKSQLGVALQQEAQRAGLPTRNKVYPDTLSRFLSHKVSPEIEASMGQPGAPEIPPTPTPKGQAQPAPVEVPTAPEDVTAGDWTKHTGLEEMVNNMTPEEKQSYLARLKSQRGSVDPKLLKLFAPIAGAAVGAPTGAYLNPDDPGAPIKGALAGGLLGYAASSGGMDELTNWRNAGLLATPSAQLKKPLSDLAGYIGLAGEKAIQGDTETAQNLAKELFRLPTNISNYGKGFMNPALTRDVIGDAANEAAKQGSGALGMVARPFAGAQYATQQAMQRAGIPLDKARDALFLGAPKTEVLQQWLGLQRNPVVRAIRPFARIGTNIFERGLERTPGIGALMGDPATKVSRQLIGAGALGLGALTGTGDTTSEEAGNEPTNPLLRGLRRAALGSYALPFSIGEGLTGPRGIRDAFFMVPGLSQTLPPPGPKETGLSYGGKFAKRWLEQMLPDWANPYPDESVR